MSDYRVESTRGGLVESIHRVSLAVVDDAGTLVAESGNPHLSTFWRSAAKPFQALPLAADGVAERFCLGAEELALACASHSSEPRHLEIGRRFLELIGCTEQDLACGPHVPLGPAVAAEVARTGTVVTPVWSNCSGKHAGMLAFARHHDWPTSGYERAGHPVQQRMTAEVAKWSGVDLDRIGLGIDGCTVVCFALPLTGMAYAYARFGTSTDAAASRIRAAMTAHPWLVAGTGRLCTELMEAAAGQVIAKIGAEGVYSAALPGLGLGIALKIESGDMRAASVALVGAIVQIVERLRPGVSADELLGAAGRFRELPTRNSRDELTGSLRATGALRFHG